jgi:hypothetical protein
MSLHCQQLIKTIERGKLNSFFIFIKQLKRNFIGMELNKKYFEIAKQRIENA